jgi:hypothetical protein
LHAAVRRSDRRDRSGREAFDDAKTGGLSLILTGALIIVRWHAAARNAVSGPSRTFGDAHFLFAAFLSACITVLIGQAKLGPLHAAALVATGSLAIYLPLYPHCTEPASQRYRSARLWFKRFSMAFS